MKTLSGGKKDYKKHKERALWLAENRIGYFNSFYNFEINRITIKKQKTRWGSCSKKRNLNFNYKIVFLPQRLADYLVVHELCHLGEMNHSRNFWKLVAKTIPDYSKLNKQLKRAVIY